MTVKERYESAKEIYAKIGVDTDATSHSFCGTC